MEVSVAGDMVPMDLMLLVLWLFKIWISSTSNPNLIQSSQYIILQYTSHTRVTLDIVLPDTALQEKFPVSLLPAPYHIQNKITYLQASIYFITHTEYNYIVLH